MKSKTVFTCQQCGTSYPKWQGQCSDCGAWNSLIESVTQPSAAREAVRPVSQMTQTLEEVTNSHSGVASRLSTHMFEFDRVLGGGEENASGGGLVKGAVILLAGEPGIGKSTLLTQFVINTLVNQEKADNSNVKASNSTQEGLAKVLYVNGEESAGQISGRIERIHKKYSKMNTDKSRVSSASGAWRKGLVFLNSTNVDEICSTIAELQPTVVIVDSIQTVRSNLLTGAAGSFGQLKECTTQIAATVKPRNIPAILIGHVTKEGVIAGPKVLEHIVDCVLELSGERTSQIRSLRAIKNRFGATDEVGLFLMVEDGLEELTNPSQLLLQTQDLSVPGSVVVCTMEGTRPLLMEIQALVVPSHLAIPRRVAQGVTPSRLQVICAVLEKHARVNLGTSDVFVNVAGGLSVKEPAADLGIAMAIASSQGNKTIPHGTVCIGELGLLGEIREVPFGARRLKEAKRLGYPRAFTSVQARHIASAVKQIFSS